MPATAPSASTRADKEHRLTTIKKAASGSTPEIVRFVAARDALTITAGIPLASRIRVAEAASVPMGTGAARMSYAF